jgi:hypothetical protein
VESTRWLAQPVKGSDVIFRKARMPHSASELDARDKRKRGREPEPEGHHFPEAESEYVAPESDSGRHRAPARDKGPHDAADIDAESGEWIDLGGLLLRPLEGTELRLQVDEGSQTVLAALIVRGDSALEIRAFAAPRSGGLWEDLRREIAAETTRRGGTVTEGTGPFGPELKVVVSGRQPDGSTGTQVSRIVGVDGPRWFLRGTLLGRAAQEPEEAEPLLHALEHVAVVRGKGPMAPRDMIPLKLPDQAS